MNAKGCDNKISKAEKKVFLTVPSNGEFFLNITNFFVNYFYSMSETISFALT